MSETTSQQPGQDPELFEAAAAAQRLISSKSLALEFSDKGGPYASDEVRSRPTYQLPDEINARDDYIAELEATNLQLNTDKTAAEAKNDLDDKTGLLKATVFKDRIIRFTALGRREEDENRIHSLLLADFDKFHDINDALGYLQADAWCLLPTAQNIKNGLRESDLACRFGGEEFVIFLPDTDLVTALGVGARLQHQTNEITLPTPVAGREFLGMSMGIVEYHQGEEYDAVFERANELVRRAKDNGRNQIITESMAESIKST